MPSPSLLADVALALGALFSFLLVGVAGLRWLRAPFAGLELLAFGAGFGVLVHGLIGIAVALSPAKQATAWALFMLVWGVAAVGLRLVASREKSAGQGLLRRENGVRSVLAILVAFLVGCVTLTHLEIRFPRELPDGIYIYKQHSLPVKLQVLAGNLPADNYLPFVVEEYLLRDVPFAREHPVLPGQEVTNRPILMALAAAPFRAALDPPPRRDGPLPRFTYVGSDWPDTGVFMDGDGFRRFLPVAIALNALALLGAALVLQAHGPRFLFVPGLLLLATSPFILSQTVFTWPKLLAAFFLLLALHALARGKNPVWVAAAGTLAYLAHPFAVVFLAGFGVHYALAVVRSPWCDRTAFRSLLVYGGVTTLGLTPWFFWTFGVLRLPSNLIVQNITGHGVNSLEDHLWVRAVSLHQALAVGTLNSFDVQTVFRRVLACLPGVLGLLTLPAYAGCALCWRSHRVFVFYGVLLPAVLLLLPFSYKVPVTLLAYHSVGVCLWLLGLVVLARAPRAVAWGLIAAQALLQTALVVAYGRSLGATWRPSGVFYRLLDHRPEIRDARHQVSFHVDLAIDGQQTAVVWLEPPARLTYRGIAVPRDGKSQFRGLIGIHPHVWQEGNADGAEFFLEVRTADGKSHRVWTADVDPFHRPEDRAWRPVTVDLSGFAGQTVDLTLGNGPGPVGNDYADWCVWGDPELVRATEN